MMLGERILVLPEHFHMVLPEHFHMVLPVHFYVGVLLKA